MGYKLTWVYMRPNGVEKQVRPSWPSERPDITSAVYDNKSITVTTQGELQWVCFSTNGVNMYYCDYGRGSVIQYSLSTAWDVSTATATGNSYNVWYNVSWVAISDDWTYLFIAAWDIWIRKYTLSTPYDVSTASTTETFGVTWNLTWISFSSDGTKLYYMNYSIQKIIEYSLPSAWTLTWATLVGELSYPVSWNTYRDCAVSSLWWKVFLVRQASTSYIYQMNMSTENNITTASYNNVNLSLNYNACGLYIKPDGTKMYVVNMGSKEIRQYTLS
jgi:DNA-binding beta-propeller fold protein YncE